MDRPPDTREGAAVVTQINQRSAPHNAVRSSVAKRESVCQQEIKLKSYALLSFS
jgi:hypothetical protein